MNYSKYPDIEAVLIRAKEQLNKIENAYGDALQSKSIPNELLVDIKDYLGNVRSALDYLACKIQSKNAYFPVANSVTDFTARVQDFPKNTISILEGVQSYKSDNWLSNFSLLSNKNKHVTLIPQTRTEIKETRITGPGGKVSWGPGVTFGSGVSVMGVQIDPITQLPVQNNVVRTEIITWVHFIFDNSDFQNLPDNISALPFLKETFQKVVKIIKDIEDLL